MLVAAILGVVAAAGAPAGAGEAPPPNTGALSLTINLNFPSAYYFRGIAQSNSGFQFQPLVELKANLYEGDEKDVLTGGYLKVAGFSHLQSQTATITSNYYEQDLSLTGGLVFWKRLTLEGGWNLYAYPGLGSTAQVQEIFGKVSFDDGGLWPFKLPGDQDFTLAPYVLMARETSGAADGARTSGGGYGTYLEVGIDPGYTFELSKAWAIRLHTPIAVGLSLDKYYEVATATGVSDETFGFADMALALDIPLKFVPPRFGKWTFSTGLHFLLLGTNTRLLAGPATASALNGLNVTGGKDFEMWTLTGLKIEYF
jgi:hypothetical protein